MNLMENWRDGMGDVKPMIPPSREVRWKDGVLVGPFEQAAFEIYKGDAGTLASWIVKLELIAEHQRSQAVESYKDMLRQRASVIGGVLVSADLDEVSKLWHESEVLDMENRRPRPNFVTNEDDD